MQSFKIRTIKLDRLLDNAERLGILIRAEICPFQAIEMYAVRVSISHIIRPGWTENLGALSFMGEEEHLVCGPNPQKLQELLSEMLAPIVKQVTIVSCHKPLDSAERDVGESICQECIDDSLPA